MTEITTPNIDDLILIGQTLKPYGLLGEMKVRPETFDIERHEKLKTVLFKRAHETEFLTLKIIASRHDDNFWFLKFENLKTPEAAAEYSGGMLFIPASERLELPEDMVYISDLIGLMAIDELGKELGPIKEIHENGAQDLIVIQTPRKEIVIPWLEPFVTSINLPEKKVMVDISLLREILEL